MQSRHRRQHTGLPKLLKALPRAYEQRAVADGHDYVAWNAFPKLLEKLVCERLGAFYEERAEVVGGVHQGVLGTVVSGGLSRVLA